MKGIKNKGGFFLLPAALLIIIVYCIYGLMNYGKEQETYQISVILEDSSNDKWNALKEGMTQNNSEFPVYVNFVSTGKLEDLNEEAMLIQRELDNGADGIVFVPCTGSKGADVIYELSQKHPIVLICRDNYELSMISSVLTDEEKAAEDLLLQIKMDFGGSLSGKTIGLADSDSDLPYPQRLRFCLCALLEREGANLVWDLAQVESTEEIREAWKETKPEIVIGMDNDVVERCVDLKLSNPEADFSLYGAGHSKKNVYYLDRGLISGLLVTNDYLTGYKSLEVLCSQMTVHTMEKQNVVTGHLIATPKNLYESEISRILYPGLS